MIIKELLIKNFRSIVSCQLPLNDLSLFVGLNDVGKSNVLKALNLFFNNETESKKSFSFLEDYSKYATKRLKKAEEITIELHIEAPKNYKGGKDIRWIKVWRKDGLHSDTITFLDGSKFPERSKLFSWLKNVRFVYVPAVRGTSYFESLLAQLHDTLAETIEEELRVAGETFISTIKKKTTGMISGIDNRLSLKSEIRLPPNLQALFKTLDFATSDGIFNISLANRGDGIKTRHIPIILKFISDQLNINKRKGAANVNMIWGYEEPENNLEMAIAFELAKEFVEYSPDIQLLLTTHSAGFYSIKGDFPDCTNLFKVKKPKGSPALLELVVDIKSIDEEMGLMPLVAPYIEEKLNDIKKLQGEILEYKAEIQKFNKHALFVEGDDEVRIFSKIIEIANSDDKIEVRRDAFGCSGVKQQLLSWSWVASLKDFKAIGLFDCDDSGKSEKGKTESEPQYKKANQDGKVKAVEFSIPLHLRNIKSKFHHFPVEIEEMYLPEVWKLCEKKSWLEKRPIEEISTFTKPDSVDQCIKDKIESMGFSDQELLFIFFKIPDQNKIKISKYLIGRSNEDFLRMVKSLLDFFNNKIAGFFTL